MAAVIFDLDGVLIESEPHWQRAVAAAVNRVASERHWDVAPFAPRDMVPYTGSRLTDVLAGAFAGLGHPEVAADEALMTALVPSVIAAATNSFLADPAPIEPSVAVAHELAAQGMTLGVASSSAPSFIEATLECIGLASVVSAVQSALYLTRGKPDGDVYRRVLQKLGEAPEDCIAIEDSAIGARAAADARLRCIVLSAAEPDERPDDFAAAVVVTPALSMEAVAAAFATPSPYVS